MIKINKKPMIAIIAIIWTVFQMYTGIFGIMSPLQQRSIHLGFALLITFLVKPYSKKADKEKLYIDQIILVTLTIIVTSYYVMNHMALSLNLGRYTNYEIFVAYAMLFLVIEASRRLTGWALVILGVIFMLYSYFGPNMPSLIRHPGASLQKIAVFMSLTTEGILGVPIEVCASFIFLFVLYAQILQATGGGEVFINLALSIVGHVRGGPAKVAVVSSMFFGSISGSAVANVVGTGTFTIPMMKKTGYKPHFAGAVEAVASSGGQFMPPIMGATAFLIAEILSIQYWKVALYALPPAILYYVAIFLMVDFEAGKTGLKGLDKKELPKAKEVFKDGWPALISPIVLVIFLAVLQLSAAKAASYAIIITVIIAQVNPKSKLTISQYIDTMIDGSIGMLETTISCATVGLVVGSITLTGLALKLSSVLLAAAGGSLALLMILTCVTSIILGMGLPTVACYMVLATMVAPSLIKMGVLPIAAHLFIFYFGIIANITPPVALASLAAAGIANADFKKTGFTALKLGLSAFIVPFVFVNEPALLLNGAAITIIRVLFTTTVGIIALSVALEGYFFNKTNVLQNILFILSAALLIDPGTITDITGIVIFVIGFILNRKSATKTVEYKY